MMILGGFTVPKKYPKYKVLNEINSRRKCLRFFAKKLMQRVFKEKHCYMLLQHAGLSICNALVCKTCLDDMASKHLGCSSNSSTTIPKLFVIVSRNPGDSLSTS